jgi:hypothetical protein
MTSPGHSFGTHDCGSAFFGKFDELIQSFLKFQCLHVVSEAAKAGISPSSVDRVTTRMPQAAESRHVPITDSSVLKRLG